MRKLKGIRPGKKQRGYDLSNAELRVVAELSGDQIFLDAFRLGWDLHTLNACELFGMEYPPSRKKYDIHEGEVCAEWRAFYQWLGEDDARRKFGKIFNFRTLYGGSPKSAYKIPGFAKLGLSRLEGEQAGYRWLAAHPALNDFWEHHGAEAISRFCVRNIWGRRRVLCSSDEGARRREGINHPVQSFVSDLINRIVIETFLECNGCGSFEELRQKMLTQESEVFLVGQCHDSLLWEFPEEKFTLLADKAVEIAERPRTFGEFKFQFPVSQYDKDFDEYMHEAEILREVA